MEENKLEQEGQKKGSNASSFLTKVKKGLFETFGKKILKYQNPEKYFQKILEVEEFENLKTLVEESKGAISWEKLAKKGVVKIKNNKVE